MKAKLFRSRQLLVALGVGTMLVGSLSGQQPARKQSFERPAIYLSDLENVQPASAVSRRWQQKAWRLLDYRAEKGTGETRASQARSFGVAARERERIEESGVVSLQDAMQQKALESQAFDGTMLVATADSQAPAVTYLIQRTGWHEIYVGIYRKPFEESKEVQVKLTDDPAYTTLTGRPGETDHQENWVDEIYYKTADLTGRDITLRQVVQPEVRHAWVAFVKLIPLSEQAVPSLLADRKRTDNKRLFVHSDAHFRNIEGSALEIRNVLEPLRSSDVSRVYWEAGGGDHALYFSSIASDFSRLTKGVKSEAFFTRSHERELAQTWQAYHRKGVDPLKVAAEFSRELGLEFYASYRVGGFIYPPPHDPAGYEPSGPASFIWGGKFLQQHPGFVCVSREGTPLLRVSYAFPETRRYVLSLFREMATNYPIDGVAILYNRRPPLVAYEAPLVEGFRKRYGEDPRKLGPGDPRWLSYRCGVLTQFMKELREELDVVAREKEAARLKVTAIVFREEENFLHGMDVKGWIQQGLVDTIIPYSSSIRLNSYLPAWDNPEDVAYFVSLVKGTQCQLALNMMPRDLTPEKYYRMAHRLYDAGVQNLFFWDGIQRVRQVLRLGHRDEVAAWMAAGEPVRAPKAVRLWQLGQWDLRLETPG